MAPTASPQEPLQDRLLKLAQTYVNNPNILHTLPSKISLTFVICIAFSSLGSAAM
jgi:hypothetical protein